METSDIPPVLETPEKPESTLPSPVLPTETPAIPKPPLLPHEVAEAQFKNYATHMAMNMRSHVALILSREFTEAKGRLIQAVGDKKADEVMSDFFIENSPLFVKPIKTAVEYR